MDILLGVLALLFVIALSLAMIFAPEFLWKLEHYFDVKDGEPSEFYLAKMRVLGVFLFLGSIFMGFWVLLTSI